jgi:anti-sigma factor (TIGR02949 family)
MNADRRLSCEEMFQRLDDYIDRNLSADEIRQVQSHLEECLVCAGEYRFESTVVSAIRERLQRIAAPPDLLAAIHAKLAGKPPRKEGP